MAKKRLDVLMVEKGLVESRQKAQAIIMAGQVYSGEKRLDKAGMTLDEDTALEVRGQTLRYVSRGGLKLEKAMKHFPIDLLGKTAADIGASTGGFTDCMLQNGAAKVYAVDVGYGQLAWSLRSDERVVVLERTNARYLSHNEIPDVLDFASIDVSFISLKLILPALRQLMSEDGEVVALIKPQFEAGREKVGKKGVMVRSFSPSTPPRRALLSRALTSLPSVAQRATLSIWGTCRPSRESRNGATWRTWCVAPTPSWKERIHEGATQPQPLPGPGA